jgi:hypothetical protein
MPDIYVRASPEIISKGIDPKIEAVKEIIKKAQPATTQRK